MSEADKYDQLEKIGHGSFGVIRKVRRKVDGMVLCRKEISYSKMSQKEREQLHAEFQILSHLRHPNIVGYYHREHLKLSQDLHLYMEYCGNGDLGRTIRELVVQNKYAEESFVWSIFSQLLTALYRCHYGIDPPEVGKNVLGLGSTAKPRVIPGGMTILHRDLKPENVFLGEDNSVKLGDFGLSKMIQSHDFASTYVGTPFYMSPEICAAEKYTLKSDIWSLGCIIYELCAREPPFNAKSHFQLVQKIKEGRITPLPNIYSSELSAVIKDCLRVNPDRRPDTASLLNLPVVRLMLKEKEVVDMSKALKAKEELMEKRMKEADQRLANLEAEKDLMRQELESSLRREWEVKARLEIDRLVNDEIEQLRQRFEDEVATRVEEELQPKKRALFGTAEPHTQDLKSSSAKSEYPSSLGAASTDADGEFPSVTDLTNLSLDSRAPESPAHDAETEPSQALKKARTPFTRAQTMFAGGHPGTPMDIEMASPSPTPLAALSLSPRRNGATKAPSSNTPTIFTEKEGKDEINLSDMDDDSGDDFPIPSPSRQPRTTKNPFAAKRPTLTTTKTAPMGRLARQAAPAAHSGPSKLNLSPAVNINIPDLQPKRSNGALRERANSPNRRLSKIPSSVNLATALGENGLQRRPSIKDKVSTRKPSSGSSSSSSSSGTEPAEPPLAGKGLVSKNTAATVRGRTLVELQQARAGGRTVDVSPKRNAFRDRMAGLNIGGATAMNTNFEEPAAVWDPERDEMPSPFLVRRKPMMRG